MKKYIIGAVALFAVLAGVWYVASPWMALSGMRDAAEAGDADTLEGYIDFAELRETTKSQMREKMAAEIADPKGEGMEGMSMMMGMAFIDPLIDQMLTPETMRAIILQKNKAALTEGKAEPEQTDSDDWTVERTGFNEFRVTPKSEDGKPVPSMIFKRDGLSWKLSKLDMSDLPFGDAPAQ